MAEETAAPFNAGERVVISPSRVEGFLQPQRKWGAEGRRGTVLNCFMPHGGREYLTVVQFDTKRPPKWPDNFIITFRPGDLQLVGPA
jgi:hypothetical protein